MHAYFDEAIVPDKAHIGRWNDDVPADERDDIDRLYDGVLERLRDAGAPLPATADQHPRMEGTERELAVTRQLLYERESEVADARLEVEEVESELEVVKGERDRALEQRDRAREQLEEAQERHETAKTQVEKVAKLRDKAVETRDKLRGLLEEAANQNSDLRRQLERMRLPDPGSR